MELTRRLALLEASAGRQQVAFAMSDIALAYATGSTEVVELMKRRLAGPLDDADDARLHELLTAIAGVPRGN